MLMMRESSSGTSILDLRLDQYGEVIERLLPTEVAGLQWDGGRHTLLHDDDLGADRHRLQRDGHGHLAGKIGILEAVRVADEFARLELDVSSAEGMGFAGAEVRERHPVGATDLSVHLVHRAGE